MTGFSTSVKKSKFYITILIVILAMLALTGCGTRSSDEGFVPQTSLEMARAMGYGINLSNTMEACDIHNRIPNRATYVYETMWGQPITTQEIITGYRNAGFKTLRIPVAWTNAMDWESGDFTINDAYLDRVAEIINYALNENMFVIVNNHWDHGWWSLFGHPDEAWREFAEQMFISMWTQIAIRYRDFDHRVIFEPSNEEWGNRFNDRTQWSPTGGILTEDECYELLTHLSQVFIDLVRETGGMNAERFLLMKGYNTDIMMTVDERFVLPVDSVPERMLLSVHYYTPWSFCGDNAGVDHWGTLSDVEEMNYLLGRLTKFTDMGIGVVIGEWGVLDNEGEDRLTFFTNFLDNNDLHGFVPVLWDTGFLFDRTLARITAPEIAELFHSRSVDARADKSVEEIIEAARLSMERTLQIAAERPEFILEADEAIAWLMFSSYDWSMQYSVGNRFDATNITRGMVAVDADVTGGEGTYTVSLDFTGTEAGYADGFIFTAVGIAHGEILFPDWYIIVEEVVINGQVAELTGIPYTTVDDGSSTTRVNLYNGWVNAIPPEARMPGGDMSGITPTPLENYWLERIRTISVTFTYTSS